MILVLFDLDGTLVDGQHSVRRTFEAVFPAFGFASPSASDVRAIIGRSLPEAIRDLLGADAPAEDMAEAYKTHFHAMRATPGYTEALYPEVDVVLRRLAKLQHLVLGTATGKALRGIRWMIEKNAWQGLFTALQGSDTAASKPSPEMVLNACRETGIAPERTIVFGDSVYDMQMAVAAGAMPIGVSWGYGAPADLLAAGAGQIIHGFGEVEAVVATFVERATTDLILSPSKDKVVAHGLPKSSILRQAQDEDFGVKPAPIAPRNGPSKREDKLDA